MRILALTNLYPTPHQPHRAAYNRQHCRAFLAAGHAVRVIAPVAWTEEWAARRDGQRSMPRGRTVVRDRILIDHPRFFFPPKVLRATYGPLMRACVAKAFERAVREFSPDVVFASWAYPDGWAAVRLGRAAGLAVVVNVVGSDVLLADTARRVRVVSTLRAADGVLAASEHLAGLVREMGVPADRVRAVHNGVDVSAFRPGDRAAARGRLGLAGERRIVLFVGNLLPVKGPEVLIDACGHLARRGELVTCFLVGHGPMRDELASRAAALGLGEAIRFVGPVDHSDLPDWFRAADVLALPSRSEGVPNVLLEAAAVGTPFVASRVGGVPEVASLGRSTMVPPGDAVTLADALAAVLAAPAIESPLPAVRSHDAAAADIVELFEQTLNRFRRCRRPAPARPVAAY